MTPGKAIFLSYASQDMDAARRISESLAAMGLEVWFDRSELRGGDAWDASIRAQIRDCALFVPVISASTESRGEGYFRLEWKLAVDRSHLMADDQAFLLPVVIDDTPEAAARVPDAFRSRQWVRLPDGRPTAEFVAHVKRLLGPKDGTIHSGKSASEPPTPPAAGRPSVGSKFPTRIVAGLAVLAFLLAAYIAHSVLTDDSGPVVPKTSAAKAGAERAPVRPAPNSVAVLPFANLSEEKGNEYFSDGISEELLTVLQKVPGLHVAARSSSFSFKGTNATAQEIGRKLGVAHLIEGSVRKSGKSVRITARLSRAATGEQLWSDGYTRDLKDVFAVQTDLAQTIVEQLRGHLGEAITASAKSQIKAQIEVAAKGGTQNAEAHQLYLQGLFDLHRLAADSAVRAQGFLERAVALDPSFALAWAALSRTAAQRAAYASTKRDYDEGWALARRAADRALKLEPELPSAHLARMTVQMLNEFAWKAAAESLRRAQRAAPTDADVIAAASALAYAIGQKERAVDLALEAVSRDPLNAETRVNLGWALDGAGRYRESQAQFQRVVELSPSAAWGHAGVSLALLHQRLFDGALREAVQESVEWSRLTMQAQALWALNRKPESDAALAALVAGYAEVAAIQIAQVHAYRRENDLAFEWLGRAARQLDSGLAWCKSDAVFAMLQDDPRWAAFLKSIGLADEQLR